MTAAGHRPSSAPADVPDAPGGPQGPDRRLLLRGGAAFGLALAAGWPLVACGGGSSQVAADLPASRGVPAAPTRAPQPSPDATVRSKSQMYRRGRGDVAESDPAPTRSARPSPRSPAEPAPSPEPAAEVSGREVSGGEVSGGEVPSKTDGLATARRADTPARRTAPALARTRDIPVGGGKIFEGQTVVVTQPTSGTFRAFDARCTHRQCIVADCAGGSINCACHSSSFSLENGAVTAGPAPKPLPARQIEVVDGEILLADQ